MEVVRSKHKTAEQLLIDSKDSIRDSIATAVTREQQRMQDMHDDEVREKKRQHELLLADQKRHL